MAKGNNQKETNSSTLDFEAELWAAADKMRGHMDASEYKHLALGLIFLKHFSDAFEEKREQLLFGFNITDRVAPLLKRISQNIHESRTLAALRDALLSKLLLGELRVLELKN